MIPRIETRRIVAERISADGHTISQIVEHVEDGESGTIQNKEKVIKNYPITGDSEMQRFSDDPIQNDSCEDVPVLEPPTYQNKSTDGEPETQFCNVQNEDGTVDSIPVLEPPSYNVGKKVARREQPKAVQNGDDDDSDVPILEPPTYGMTR